MGHVNIELDMGRVQSSVQAAVRPAVETALAGIDIKARIVEVLERPNLSGSDRYSFARMMGYEGEPSSLIDSLIVESIRELAKEYVRHHIAVQKGEIEEAFRKMMSGSANRLVKAFAKATEKALEEDWGFDLKVSVEHTVPASESGGYDD